MNYEKVVILGAGGFARETYTIYVDQKQEDRVIGFAEERSSRMGPLIDSKPVYDISRLQEISAKSSLLLIGGIGSNKRVNLIQDLEESDYKFDTLVHPSVIKSKWVSIGTGSIITAGVILTAEVKIGRHVILNLSCSVGHNANVGDFSTVSPGTRISGNATVGKGVFIGNNASINEYVNIGDGAVIASGAVVIEDVPELSLAAGVPATIKKTYTSIDARPW